MEHFEMFYSCAQKANETEDGPVCTLEQSLAEGADPAAATTAKKDRKREKRRRNSLNFLFELSNCASAE